MECHPELHCILDGSVSECPIRKCLNHQHSYYEPVTSAPKHFAELQRNVDQQHGDLGACLRVYAGHSMYLLVHLDLRYIPTAPKNTQEIGFEFIRVQDLDSLLFNSTPSHHYGLNQANRVRQGGQNVELLCLKTKMLETSPRNTFREFQVWLGLSSSEKPPYVPFHSNSVLSITFFRIVKVPCNIFVWCLSRGKSIPQILEPVF